MLTMETTITAPELSGMGNDLLRACRNGDAAAWQQIVTQYERLVYSIPLRMGLSRDDAADIFQLTFAALMNSLEAIRDEAKLGGWLATVARRHSWRLIREGKTQTHIDDESEETLSQSASILGYGDSERIQEWEVSQWVGQSLDKLQDRCRELLRQLYFSTNEPAYTDIARQLGIPIGSIGPTQARCLERLRELMEGE